MELAARECFFAEPWRHREVDARGHHVAESVNDQSGVVRDDSLGHSLLIATPQRPADQILALARGEIAQPEEAVAYPQPVAA